MVDWSIVAAEGGADRLSTGGGASRHIDRAPDGTLWQGYRLVGNFNLFYSKDGGVSWTWTSSSQTFNGIITHADDFSFFIDLDGFMHVTYCKYVGGGGDGRTTANSVIYRRGTPINNGTAWSWSGEVLITGVDYWHCPQVVAHRQGSGWKVHTLTAYNWTDNRTIVHYCRFNVTSAGAITTDVSTFLHDSPGAQTYHSHPSLEFRHNGDGKTVQQIGGVEQPDLFMCWTSSNVLHWGKLSYIGNDNWGNFSYTYSNPTTGWGRVQASTPFMEGLYQHHRWARMLYDAVTHRYMFVGMLSNSAVTVQYLFCEEWNADAPNHFGSPSGASYAAGSPYFYSGDACLLPNGDVEVVGVDIWNPGASRLSRVLVKRPLGSNTRTLAEHEVVESSGHSEPSVSFLQYPQGASVFTFNKGGTVYRARRSLSNLFMLVGGQVKNVMRYRNVGGNPVPIYSERGS